VLDQNGAGVLRPQTPDYPRGRSASQERSVPRRGKFLGVDDQDPLFLQIKEAQPSVLERFVGKSEYSNHASGSYGKVCGWTLARAHARSGDRIAISSYLGKSDAFDRAMASFAETYAE
jgi:hypothetical protein